MAVAASCTGVVWWREEGIQIYFFLIYLFLKFIRCVDERAYEFVVPFVPGSGAPRHPAGGGVPGRRPDKRPGGMGGEVRGDGGGGGARGGALHPGGLSRAASLLVVVPHQKFVYLYRVLPPSG